VSKTTAVSGRIFRPDGALARLARRGLQAYQANGLALAERALGAAYPVLAQLIGDESFAPLARHFWRRHPPGRGDMACWGDVLAAFLEASPQLADEPYLGDVARVEWALHQAATAADAQPDPHSFALLSSADPAELTLTLGAGVFLLASVYPVASIVNAHLLGEPALAEAAALLRAGAAEHALVWRQGFKPRVCAITAAEYALLAALQAGSSLEAALDSALTCAPIGTSGCRSSVQLRKLAGPGRTRRPCHRGASADAPFQRLICRTQPFQLS
jgi:hypothetical protein